MWCPEISHKHPLLLYGLFLSKSYKEEKLFVQANQSNGFKYLLNKDVFKYSCSPRTVREWNSLPSDIVPARL